MGKKESDVVLNFKTSGQIQYAQTIKQINQTMNTAASEYRNHISSMDKDASQTAKLTAAKKKLEIQLQGAEKRTKMLREEYEKSVKETGEYSEQSQKLYKQLMDSENGENKLRHSLSETNEELKKQGDFSVSTAEKMKKIEDAGDKVKKVGEGMTKYVTTPILGLGAASTKVASDFDNAFTGVKKTVDELKDKNGKVIISYDDLENKIRDLATTIPATTEEISAVAEAAGQLGIKTENVMSFTETMMKMGVATNMSSEEAAVSLAKLANITKMPQENFNRLGDAITALGNNSATTEKDIVDMSLRLAGSAKQANMSETDILGMAAAMSSVGINAEAGGGSMSRVMQKINSDVMSGGGNLEQFAKMAGMSAEEFQKAWKENAAGSLSKFVKGLGEAKNSGEDVTGALKKLGITSTQEVDTMLRLSGAGEVLDQSLRTSADGWKENTALTDEANKRYETFESKLQIAKNRIGDFSIELGQVLLPMVSNVVTKLSGLLQNFSEWFAKLSPETKRMIVLIGGIVAAVGPMLVIFGTLMGSISKIAMGFKVLSAAFSFIISPVGLVVVAIVALIAIFVTLYNKCEWFRNFWNATMKFFVDIGKQALNYMAGFFSNVFGGIGKNISNFVNAWKNIFNGLINFVKGAFSGNWRQAWEGVKQIFSGIVGGFTAILKAPINAMIGLINGFIGGLNRVKIPKWVPGVGGKGINVPTIPYLAEGGHLLGDAQAIVGEAGPELLTTKGSRTTVTPLSPDEKARGIGGKVGGETKVDIHMQVGSLHTNSMNEVDQLNRNLMKSARKASLLVGGT